MNYRELLLLAYAKGYRVSDSGQMFGPKGRQLKDRLRFGGYPTFGVKVGGTVQSMDVHRLAAYQKFGNGIFVAGLEVRHLDGNPANNSASNLELGTHQRNMMDIKPEVRRRKAVIASSHLRRYDDEVVAAVRAARSNGEYFRSIAERMKIPLSTVFYIINGASY